MHVHNAKHKKWDPKSKELIFVRYFTVTKGYRLFDLKVKFIHKARDVAYFENQKY